MPLRPLRPQRRNAGPGVRLPGPMGRSRCGEARAEMIRRFESKGVVFAPEDVALSTPHLRKVGRLRLADRSAA